MENAIDFQFIYDDYKYYYKLTIVSLVSSRIIQKLAAKLSMITQQPNKTNKYEISLLFLMILQILKIVTQLIGLILVIAFDLTQFANARKNRLNQCSTYINNKYNYYYDIIFTQVFAITILGLLIASISLILIVRQFYKQRKNKQDQDQIDQYNSLKSKSRQTKANQFNKIFQVYYALTSIQGILAIIGFGQFFNIIFQSKNCPTGEINAQYLSIAAVQLIVLVIVVMIWVLTIRYFYWFNFQKTKQNQSYKAEMNKYLQNSNNQRGSKNKQLKNNFQLLNLKPIRQNNSKQIKNSLLNYENDNFESIYQADQYQYQNRQHKIKQYNTIYPIREQEESSDNYKQRNFKQNKNFLVYQNRKATMKNKQVNHQQDGNNSKQVQNPLKNSHLSDNKAKNVQKKQKIQINQKGQLLIPKKSKFNQKSNISFNSNVMSYSTNHYQDQLEQSNNGQDINNLPIMQKKSTVNLQKSLGANSINLNKQENKQLKKQTRKNQTFNANKQEGATNQSDNKSHKLKSNLQIQNNVNLQDCPIDQFIDEDQKYQNQQYKIAKFMKNNKKKKKVRAFNQDDSEGAILYFHKRKNNEQRSNVTNAFNPFIDDNQLAQIKLMSQNLSQMKQRNGFTNQKSQIKAKLKQFQINTKQPQSNNSNNNHSNMNFLGNLLNKKIVKKDGQLTDFIRSKFSY